MCNYIMYNVDKALNVFIEKKLNRKNIISYRISNPYVNVNKMFYIYLLQNRVELGNKVVEISLRETSIQLKNTFKLKLEQKQKVTCKPNAHFDLVEISH